MFSNLMHASRIKRLINLIVDGTIILFLVGFTEIICGKIFNIFDSFLWTSLNLYYVFYYWLLESNFKGRTIGKFITNTKVISINGNDINYLDAFARTILRAVPFDFISIFIDKKNTWHDLLSKTLVVNNQKNKQLFTSGLTNVEHTRLSYKAGDLYN